jgi:inosine-uridine nucleoside N-ribohydrolase
MPQTILIDTDAGDDVDDVLAIAFALRRPELDIKAITTVSPYSARRAALIQKLLQLTGKSSIPVAAGMEWPLRALTDDEREFLRRPYVGNHCVFEPMAAPDEDAVSLIIRTVEAHAGDITIVTIGPLTNIAAALCRAPEIASKIRGIALMGGEVHLPQAEHNIKWDYHASSIVFSAGIPLFMGTWSMTRRFVLMPEDCEKIKNADTPLCDFLAQCIELWWPHKGGKPGPVMYDIVPLLWSYAPDYYATEAMNIAVETKGEFTTGMTIKRPGAPNAQVSVVMRERDVKELYLQTILES